MNPSITYHFVEAAEFMAFFKAHEKEIYSNCFTFPVNDMMSEVEKEQRKTNMERMSGVGKYYLLAKVGEKVVGWSYGEQRSADDFFMRNSAVLPEYRRSGVYTGLLQEAVKFIAEMGFQRIVSVHQMTNNAILIAKMKFGFVLSGFRVSDKNGIMAELTYFTSGQRKAIYEVRVGARKPWEEFKNQIC